jgi:ankyrin repeat protein
MIILIAFGLDINHINKSGLTPLMYSIQLKEKGFYKLLLSG